MAEQEQSAPAAAAQAAPKPQQKPTVKQQSIEVEPGTRASYLATDGKLVEYLYEDAKTCYDTLLRGQRLSGSDPCLGKRADPKSGYQWQTYDEVISIAEKVGSGFLAKGQAASNDTMIGIYASNCVEWVLTGWACYMYSMVSVPLYDTLGDDACSFIISQTNLSLIICDKSSKVVHLLQNKAQTPALKTIVLLEPVPDNMRNDAQEAGVEMMTFEDLVNLGAANIQERVPPKPDDLMTVCYTSGTTGNPKGVMLTHRNVIADVSAVLMQGFLVKKEDVHLSYLPLAHAFERMVQEAVIMHGGRIGFSQGDVKVLMDDMSTLKPTILPIVPRLLNRIYDKVMLGVQSSSFKRFLFNMGLRKKQDAIKRGHFGHSIWDKLVFGKVQALMGGRVRMMVVGAAPTNPDILNFSRCVLGARFFEGYGQTEATAGITVTIPDENEAGHVGTVLPCNLVKLVDIPEMDYYVKDNKGEVCAKGHNVMKGYYADPEKTREAIDEDGWLHTGDVGQWLPNGTLKIIDRRKHIFKLAQGEYLAPEKVEGIYARHSLVAQVFLDGNSSETYAVAVIVPDVETVTPWAERNGLKGKSMDELCQNDKLKQEILQGITAIGKESKLRGFEQARDIFLHPDPFTPENNLTTPTFKSKRPQLRRKFEEQITAMYNNNRAQQAAASGSNGK